MRPEEALAGSLASGVGDTGFDDMTEPPAGVLGFLEAALGEPVE